MKKMFLQKACICVLSNSDTTFKQYFFVVKERTNKQINYKQQGKDTNEIKRGFFKVGLVFRYKTLQKWNNQM